MNTTPNNETTTKAGADAMAEAKKGILKEIGAKWNKFSETELSALKSKDDLVAQVVAKYGLGKPQAQTDVDALLKNRAF